MQTAFLKTCCVPGLLAALATAAAAAETDEITVEPVFVAESRGINLKEQPKQKQTRFPLQSNNRLSVRFQLSGKAIANASHRSLFVIRSARDDTGASLVWEKNKSIATKTDSMIRIRQAGVLVLDMLALLKTPRRAAETIKELTGSVRLRVATEVDTFTIPLTDLPRNQKTNGPVSNGELKQRDLAARLVRFTSFEKSGTSLLLQVTGKDSDAIFAARFADRNGKPVGAPLSVFSSRKRVRISSYKPGLLSADVAGLRIRIARKTKQIEVPVRLKNIPLP